MAHFVLVHGMFHAGWCWEALAGRLRAAGHRVDTPDLAGCGAGADPADASLEAWADAVARLARAAGTRAILVGHSRGGIVVSQAAEAAPEAVGALVYVTALMLPDGAAVMDLPRIVSKEGFATREGDLAELDFTPDGRAARLKPEAAERLYAPVDAAIRAKAMSRMTPEPVAPLMTPLRLTPARYGSAARVYVAATRDGLLPHNAQQALIARSPPAEVHALDADHMLILTHVEPLAALLEDVAARHRGLGG